MWAFTGGSHYDSDFEKYEKSYISKKFKSFKKCLSEKIQFIAISDWLKEKAKKVLFLVVEILKQFTIILIFQASILFQK